jgi:hypothetical protein
MKVIALKTGGAGIEPANRIDRALPMVFVLLLFYFRPSSGGPSIHTVIPAKSSILPMKNAIGF